MTTIIIKAISFFSILSLVIAQDSQSTLSSAQIWGFGTLTGMGLSLMGFVAAILLVQLKRCISEETFKIMVNLLYSLGCGALLGDAIVHILPQSYGNDQTNPRIVSLIFICSIAFFIVLERLFEACGIVHEHWQGDKHEHQIGNQNEAEANQVNKEKNELGESILEINNKMKQEVKNNPDPTQRKNCLQNLKGKGAPGYLNLLSSFIHNFFDGFAVGVGFASGNRLVYIPIVVAIFAHEIPREMADVGILIKNGFSPIQTILCNGCVNIMSLVGLFIGLATAGISDAVQNYILTFVAGNFTYIAAEIWKHILRNKRGCMNLFEFGCFVLGVGAMYLVLLAEN